MFEFHGWVNFVEDASDDALVSVLDVRRKKLCDELANKIKEIETCNGIFQLFRRLNGQAHLVITGFTNHRQESVIKLLYWIAERQPYSYGLLHIRDDEDRGFDNVVRVFSLARGKVIETSEELLSPCIPKIEPTWNESGK